MLRLASMLYSIIGTTMAGILIIAALTAGYDTLVPIIIAAGIGAVAGLPISYLVAQAIIKNKV
ncbi:MAG: CTP synthetase [Yoonia sp.]|jgi:hypothetical protein